MGKIQIGFLVLGMLGTNVYYIYREGGKECVVIDPADRSGDLVLLLKGMGLTVKAILLTHGHFDHIYGVNALKGLAQCPVYAMDEEKEMLADVNDNLSEQFGHPTIVEADELLRDGDEFRLADIDFKVFLTPGHTGGSCAYYVKEAGAVISGDTLFCGSIGRTDFPTGSERKLLESVETKLFVLPDETKVYPGHGCQTTIGGEKENNPYF